jgi:hypothetical protein
VAKDFEMALRFFFMVVTDFFCWAPIIFLKVITLQEYRIPRKLKKFCILIAEQVHTYYY